MSEITLNNENQDLSLNKNIFLIISSLFLGIIFNILFYGKTPGISITLFTITFYIIFLLVFKNCFDKKFSFKNSLLLFIILISLYYSFFANELFLILDLLALPLLILAHTILVTNKNTKKWFQIPFIENILYGFFYGMFAFTFKPITLVANMKSLNKTNTKNENMKKVLMGLLISLPLLFIIIWLLSSADMVFSNMIGNLTKIFDNINISEIIGRLILIIVVSALIFSYLWYLSLPNNENTTESISTQKNNSLGFDPIVVSTILISINIVYFLFTIIQFTYLFGSISHNLPQNLTFAEYARRGFFELVVVTLINLTILLLIVSFTKCNKNKISILIRILSSFLVFCTGIMLFSAHFRMSLYEKTYGYTYLRVFTHTFMLYIFALLIIALVKIWNKKLIILKYYIVISLIAYVLINFMNVDSVIAKNNIDRYNSTGKIDINYLTMLSYDATPQLLDFLPELKAKDPSSAIQLENRLYNEKCNLKNYNSWQSFNLSINNAKNALAKYNLTYSENGDDNL